jgi:hypothetical protein
MCLNLQIYRIIACTDTLYMRIEYGLSVFCMLWNHDTVYRIITGAYMLPWRAFNPQNLRRKDSYTFLDT